ncbi:MAG: TlpA disulfide reductase family protein [Kiloniellales bacterium]|nr:TlpA disulfide reductase family protein [Kiloniellales bacterium]
MIKSSSLASFALLIHLASGLAFSGFWFGAGQALAQEQAIAGHIQENFILPPEPLPAPKTPVKDLLDNSVSLADYEGRLVLLNFWATWCAPCIREMPSLDRLQAKFEGRPFNVVAVSLDRAGKKKVEPFLQRIPLANLDILLDPRSKLARELVVSGLPTTFLLADDGRVIGALQGPAEWDEEDAVNFIESYMPDRGPS